MGKTLHILGDSFCCDFDWWDENVEYNDFKSSEEYNSSHQWIDIVKNNLKFDEVKNHSQAGCSMYYLLVKLNQLIRNKEIKKDDKIIIGLTSISRIQHPYKTKTAGKVYFLESDEWNDINNRMKTDNDINFLESLTYWGIEMNAWLPIVLYHFLTHYKIDFCFASFIYHNNLDTHFDKSLKTHPIQKLIFGRETKTRISNYYGEDNDMPTHLDKKGNKKLANDLTKFLEEIW